MGTVYKARDRSDGGCVAVKVMRGSDVIAAERFEQEAALLAEFSHSAIVRSVAHGTTRDGTHSLAMEWLEGETLGQRLARVGLTARESLAVTRRVADALAYGHGRGVV